MKYIELENFRLFKEKNRFDLAPLTILTGKNNSGKSSLFKAMMLLSDYVNSDNHLQISLDGPLKNKHKLTTNDNIVTWNSNEKRFRICYHNEYLIFDLWFSGEPKETTAWLSKLILKTVNGDQYLELNRLSNEKFDLVFSLGFMHSVMETSLDDFDGEYIFDINNLRNQLAKERLNLRKIRKEIRKQKTYLNSDLSDLIQQKALGTKKATGLSNILKGLDKVYGKDSALNTDIHISGSSTSFKHKLTLGHIIFSIIYSNKDKYEIVKLTEQYQRFIDRKFELRIALSDIKHKLNQWLSFKIFHLGPNRFYPSTFYDESNQDNSEIFNVIKSFNRNKPIPGGKKDRFFKKWLKAFNIADDIEIDNEYAPNLFFIDYKIQSKYLKPTELGYGSGQLLTILLNIAGLQLNDPVPNSNDIFNGLIAEVVSPGKIILIIEEPESNLHPHFQALLAEMLYEASIHFDLDIIIEIHSEYMIRRLMKLVAINGTTNLDNLKETKSAVFNMMNISENNLKLYYLHTNKQDSLCEKINFLYDGRLSRELNDEFMGVADSDAIDLFRIRAQNKDE